MYSTDMFKFLLSSNNLSRFSYLNSPLKIRMQSTSKINHCYNALKERLEKQTLKVNNEIKDYNNNLNSLSVDDYYYVMSVMHANGICYDTYKNIFRNNEL